MPWNGGKAVELALPFSGCPKESQPERTKPPKAAYRGGRKEKASRRLPPGRETRIRASACWLSREADPAALPRSRLALRAALALPARD